MTRDETLELLGEIRTVYPSFCRQMDEDGLRRVVDSWARLFEKRDFALMCEGLDRYMAGNRFAPSPAEVIGAAEDLRREKCDILQNDWHPAWRKQ